MNLYNLSQIVFMNKTQLFFTSTNKNQISCSRYVIFSIVQNDTLAIETIVLALNFTKSKKYNLS